ncbi:MAG: glycosyltransferase family 2 protein [Rhodothermales bacterium]
MSLAARVHVIVVNYQTPDLLDTAVRSFVEHYPDVPLLIVDNGSRDASRDVIETLHADLANVSSLRLEENRYHGPAMDLALRHVDVDYVFLLDSDTKTMRGGFLEEMLARSEEPNVYGVGKIAEVNERGFAATRGIPVLVSAYMLIDRERYLDLPPFIHHGLPALQNFRAAAEAGYRLEPFPVDEYIEHFGRGTAERYGYGLGWKGRLDYLLNKLGF